MAYEMYGLLALCALFVVVFARAKEWGTTLLFAAIFVSFASLAHFGTSSGGAPAPMAAQEPETG